jgi:integration host factor subunit beta
MLKKDLINALVEKNGMTSCAAPDAIDHLFDTMRRSLARGEHIEIRGFGRFRVRKHRGYSGRHPRTLAPIDIPPKRGVLFRAGKELTERLNSVAAATTDPVRKTDLDADPE